MSAIGNSGPSLSLKYNPSLKMPIADMDRSIPRYP